MKKLIFIYDSNKFPDYGYYSLEHAIRCSGCEVILLTNCQGIKIDGLTVFDIHDFYSSIEFKNSGIYINSDKKFRNGFWYKVLERFLILQAYTEKYGVENYYHAELDNLIFNLSGLNIRLDAVGKGIFIPKESISRCIASLVYINNNEILSELNKYILSCEYYSNDMEVLNNFSNISKNQLNFFYLPTEAYFNDKRSWNNISVDQAGGLFDGAAFGQWLFGFDPANSYKGIVSNRAINENVNFPIENLKFYINNKYFYIIKNKQKIRLYNIHVHSKIHKKLSSFYNFNVILNALNKGDKKIISFNLNKFLKYYFKKIIKKIIK